MIVPLWGMPLPTRSTEGLDSAGRMLGRERPPEALPRLSALCQQAAQQGALPPAGCCWVECFAVKSQLSEPGDSWETCTSISCVVAGSAGVQPSMNRRGDSLNRVAALKARRSPWSNSNR